MNPDSRHDQKDFTRDEYRALLRLGRRAWRFRTYADFERAERFAIWRHDVDFSVQAARSLARIEAEEEIATTYFFHLHSEFYNLLEAGVAQAAREIVDLGHAAGLHFDSHFHGLTAENMLDDAVRWEAEILEHVLGVPVRVFSFHNTTPFTMSCQRWSYGDRINTYASYFRADVGYVSDSNGYWRHRRLRDVLTQASDQALQVLTHPGWWTETPMSPAERVERCIAGRAEATRKYYRDALEQFGRPNIGGRPADEGERRGGESASRN